jgi:hypothetical protein
MLNIFKGTSNTTINEFIEKLIGICFEEAKEKDRFGDFRSCPELTDKELFCILLKRVLGKFDSGREFLQELKWDKINVVKTTLFDALNSTRRTRVFSKVFEIFYLKLREICSNNGIDNLSKFPELDEYSVFSGDGHFINHSQHIKSPSGKKYAAGSIFAVDVRNLLITPMIEISVGDKKPHEISYLKTVIENIEPTDFGKRNMIMIYDRAAISYEWWANQKKRKHYFITRLKSNSSELKSGYIPFDKTDPINDGVKEYYMSGFASSQRIFHIVKIIDPKTGKEIKFVTNLPMSFRPGLIAWLYFKRWDIEKIFDTFKNDLKETKAWATSKTSLKKQSLMIAFTYNIIRFMHEMIIKSDKINANNKTISEKKYEKEIVRREKEAIAIGGKKYPDFYKTIRMSRLPSAFVRSFRSCFFNNIAISDVLRHLTTILYVGT